MVQEYIPTPLVYSVGDMVEQLAYIAEYWLAAMLVIKWSWPYIEMLTHEDKDVPHSYVVGNSAPLPGQNKVSGSRIS